MSFNPRPPAEGDLRRCFRNIIDFLFQSTPSCGVRPRRSSTPSAPPCPFQSTPSCGGRPRHPRAFSHPLQVSIHALLRRATIVVDRVVGDIACFNPRPPAEGDMNIIIWWSALRGFNPRPPAEGDRRHGLQPAGSRRFNPRPPAEGDGLISRVRSDIRRFNPRPPAEGDKNVLALGPIGSRFQSTPSCGGRQSDASFLRFVKRFQSTPSCGGRRVITTRFQSILYVSIHALLRRATIADCTSMSGKFWFQSTPSCGGRPMKSTSNRVLLTCFNPRPPAEGYHR